jgi:hypothetical protein
MLNQLFFVYILVTFNIFFILKEQFNMRFQKYLESECRINSKKNRLKLIRRFFKNIIGWLI